LQNSATGAGFKNYNKKRRKCSEEGRFSIE